MFDLTPWGVVDEAVLRSFKRLLADMGLLLHNRPDGYQFALKSGLYAFVSLMFEKLRYRSAANDSKGKGPLKDFDLIKQYIKENFQVDLDQTKIGLELGMSRSKMYRVLRAVGASGTNDLINYYRAEHAGHLLRNTKKSVASIAAESGFTSDVSFYRVFKEYIGVPPAEYRKKPNVTAAPVGIQGYAAVNAPESVGLLKRYAGLQVLKE
jgi:AraC-like DNA-binding protein